MSRTRCRQTRFHYRYPKPGSLDGDDDGDGDDGGHGADDLVRKAPSAASEERFQGSSGDSGSMAEAPAAVAAGEQSQRSPW